MREQISKILQSVAVDTMEKLAFMFAYGYDGAEPLASETSVCAAVAFNGPFGGTLTMEICSADLAEMAGNMLGMDDGEQLNFEQQQDALKETLNVLCGNILPAIAGREAVFDIDPPTILADGRPETERSAATSFAETVFNLEEGACRLALYFDEPIPDGALMPEVAL